MIVINKIMAHAQNDHLLGCKQFPNRRHPNYKMYFQLIEGYETRVLSFPKLLIKGVLRMEM